MNEHPTSFGLSLDTLVIDLLARYPAVERVLDRYRSGREGAKHHAVTGETLVPPETSASPKRPASPKQSLHHFAQSHGVEESTLMDDIRRVIATSAHHHTASKLAAGIKPRLADVIYRPYFLGGIAVTLTVGASWGLWLLWKIGVDGAFASASIDQINAHGHAQVFGWVGLFIMGVSLQIMPRMWRVNLPAPKLALASFVVMIVGILIRSVAIACGGGAAGGHWAGLLPASIALAGGVIECIAIFAVIGILVTAFRRSEAKFEPYMAFIFGGLGWFVIQAVYGLWHIWMIMTATTTDQLLWYLSTYQAPLRDFQFHGLALFMILGVSIRMFPAMFGLPRLSDRRAWIGFGLLVTAVVGAAGTFIAFRWTNNEALAGVLWLFWLAMTIGVLMVALPWKLWRPIVTHDRSAKFIRIAYGWLAVSLGMLLFMPVYLIIRMHLQPSAMPFSHAYYGSMRHAMAVGFISMMIMGMAAKFVPNLTGRSGQPLTRLMGPFWLINIGCFIRVTTQVLTDWFPAAYHVIGISGTLEVIALVWWAAHLVHLMLTRPKAGRKEKMLAGGTGVSPVFAEGENIHQMVRGGQ